MSWNPVASPFRPLDATFLASPLRGRKAPFAHLYPFPLLQTVLSCAALTAAELAAPALAAAQSAQGASARLSGAGGAGAGARRRRDAAELDAELALQAQQKMLEDARAALAPLLDGGPEGAARVLWRPVLKELAKESLRRAAEAAALARARGAGARSGAGGGGSGGEGAAASARLADAARLFRDPAAAAREAARIRAEDEAPRGARAPAATLSLLSRLEVAGHVALRAAPPPCLLDKAVYVLVEHADLLMGACERFARRSELVARLAAANGSRAPGGGGGGAGGGGGGGGAAAAHERPLLARLAAALSLPALLPGAPPSAAAAAAAAALAALDAEEDRLVPREPSPAGKALLAGALGPGAARGTREGSAAALALAALGVVDAPAERRARARARNAASLLHALALDRRLHADLLRVLLRAAAALALEIVGAGVGTFLWPGSGTALLLGLGGMAGFVAV